MNTQSFSKKQLTIQEEQWLTQLNQIIDESLHHSDFTVNKLLKPMCINRTGLYQKLKTLTQQTPHQYIQDRRLAKAHELIMSNTYNGLHHIVIAVGFKSFNHFKRLYQATYDNNPIVVFEQLWKKRLKATILQNITNTRYNVEHLAGFCTQCFLSTGQASNRTFTWSLYSTNSHGKSE